MWADASLMQNAYRLGGDQGRFFGRFCQHAVASDQRCANLADEDRERKIPRTDAHAGAERAGTVAHRPPCISSIVSQKIDAFAYPSDACDNRYACLAHAQAQNTES